jgi:predicted MFS family arabinose efflux permease
MSRAPENESAPRPRVVGAIVFLCLFAAQSGQLALTPVLADVARTFGLSTAGAGQIRTAAAAVAALAALVLGQLVSRIRLRTVLSFGVALVAAGAALSLVARTVSLLVVAQAVTGAASAILVSAGVAAAAAWSDGADRGRIVAWALVGAPAAWVVAMPVIGVVAATSWRLAFVVPVAAAGFAAVALRRAPTSQAPSAAPATVRTLLAERSLRGWAVAELLAYAAWSGVLVYAGALFIESYGTSLSHVGVSLGLGAAAYIPGTFVAQRIAGTRARMLLAVAGLLLAASVVIFGVLRLGVVSSTIMFGMLCLFAGARTYLGSTVGLDLAAGHHASAMSLRTAAAQVGWILGSGVGGAALAVGGYPALALILAALFTAAALVHRTALSPLMRRRRGRATRQAPHPPEAAPAHAR